MFIDHRSSVRGPLPEAETTRRLNLARRLSVALAADPNVRGIAVTGSAAHGRCDRVSDLDMILYLREPVSDETFERLVREAKESGGDLYGGNAAEGFALWKVVEGIKVDHGYDRVDEMQSRIDKVLDESNLDLDTQLMIDGIRTGVVLHDPDGHVAGWIERTNEYPVALAHAMIGKFLGQRPAWIWHHMIADRGEVMMWREEALELTKRLLAVLYALNRRWHPGKLKGLDRGELSFAISPPVFRGRLERLFTDELDRAVQVAEALTAEVFALVEQHEPACVEAVEKARSRFRMPVPGLPTMDV